MREGEDDEKVVSLFRSADSVPPATTASGVSPGVFMITDQAVPLTFRDLLHLVLNWLIGCRTLHVKGHWSMAMKPVRADVWMAKR